MSGSVINKTVIRREIIHINRIYSETASRKKLILLVSDNSMEAVSLYCYHMKKRNTVFFVGNTKKAPDIAALIDHFMPDEIFLDRKKMRDVESEPALYEEIEENYQTGSPYYQYVRLQRRQEIKDVLYDDLALLMVTSFCGVPYTYEILDYLRILSKPWKELRLLTQAGGAMSCEMKQKLLEWIYDRRQRGIKTHLAIMYGQTEATARMSTFFLDQHPEKMDSVGRAISGGFFQIKNGDHTGAGDIYYHGANVCLGYVEERADLEEDAVVWRQKRNLLDTGDVGKLDEEGYLYITGRKKRFIKCNGIRISLDELERGIENKWAIPVVCVSKTLDEQILLFIRTKDFRNIDIMELTEYLRQLGIRKEQCRIRKIPAFHYCDNGKLDYASFK